MGASTTSTSFIRVPTTIPLHLKCSKDYRRGAISRGPRDSRELWLKISRSICFTTDAKRRIMWLFTQEVSRSGHFSEHPDYWQAVPKPARKSKRSPVFTAPFPLISEGPQFEVQPNWALKRSKSETLVIPSKFRSVLQV